MPPQPSENGGWDIFKKEKKLKIICDRNMNFHSKSTEGGLIHAPQRQAVVVPEDVREHPLFEKLVRRGHVAIIQDTVLSRRAMQLARNPLSEEDERKFAPSSDLPPSKIPTAPPVDSVDEDDEDGDEDENEDEDEDTRPATKPAEGNG